MMHTYGILRTVAAKFVDAVSSLKLHVSLHRDCLKPTNCECVHLVTRGHLQSRGKDGSHIIRSAITENPMLHSNFMAVCYRTVIVDGSFTLPEYGFSIFFAPLTLTLTQ